MQYEREMQAERSSRHQGHEQPAEPLFVMTVGYQKFGNTEAKNSAPRHGVATPITRRTAWIT